MKFPLVTLIKEVIDETLLINSEYLINYICPNDYILNADYDSIKQVLRILMDNSIKFSSSSGEILIEAEGKSEGTVIRVKDKGCSIPAGSLPYIFNISSYSIDTPILGVSILILNY